MMKEKTGTDRNDHTRVLIFAGPALINSFQPIFQGGFLFRCQVGRSLEDFLLRQLALTREFVADKVSTVFLNGQCVDNFASAMLKKGSVVAFSSALPGLAGATLRRGGLYACLRSSITYREEAMHIPPQKGTITVKVFNLLMEELGAVFLEKGITISRFVFVEFLRAQKENFWSDIRAVQLEGASLNPRNLLERNAFGNDNFITVCVVAGDRTQ
jgi:hypothetical protein